MPDVSAWTLVGPIVGMTAMVFSSIRLFNKYSDLVLAHDDLKDEVRELRRNALAGDNWQEMMPFPLDDARQVVVFNDRVPTEQDRISGECPVVWISVEHQRTWMSIPDAPGRWHEQTHRDPEGYNHHFAVTMGDQFIYIHASEHPGLRELVDAITQHSGPEPLREPQAVRTARGLPNVVARLFDSAGGDNCTSWADMVRGSITGTTTRRARRAGPQGAGPRPINLE